MRGPPVSFAVVVPTRDRPLQLAGCLEALERLDYPRELLTVVVVDDGGATPLGPVLARHDDTIDLRVVRTRGIGPARARNAGAEASDHSYLAFTDDDCRPDPGWLSAFASAAQTAPGALLGGRTLNGLPENVYATASQTLCDYLLGYAERAGGSAWFFPSNNLALARARFDELGGFDETFPLAAGEDRDLGDRAREAGLPLVSVRDALVLHAHVLTLAGFASQHVRYGRGAAHFRSARLRRGRNAVPVEPPRFYAEMISFPFAREERLGRAAGLAALLALSQAATAAGFAAERLAEWREAQHRVQSSRPA